MGDAGAGAMSRPAQSRPPRFAIARDSLTGGVARLAGPELHHLRNVMRLKPGAPIALIDEHGAEYDGVIKSFEPRHAVIEVTARPVLAVPRCMIVLAAAIIKGPRMDFLVEKATELGAAGLCPILCARGVVRAPGAERIARWRRLAIAAAKQSRAAYPMEIREPLDFADAIRIQPADTLGVICAIGAAPLGVQIRRILSEGTLPSRILIACGPEGDFAPEELAMAEAQGFVKAGLGTNRLRSETAALAALAIAGAALDDLDGGS
jgi:16S rRNA (uracil1498-N3)-methyltransferase